MAEALSGCFQVLLVNGQMEVAQAILHLLDCPI